MTRSTLRWAAPFLALLGAAGCARREPPFSAASKTSVPVRVIPVVAQDVTYRIQALGSLEAEEIMQVTAEVEGAVTQVLFHEGDRVTSETVLLRIDPERYRLQAEQAEATHRKALADAHRAEDDRQRREALALQQLVSAEDLLRARQEAERLAADTMAAKAAWDIALQNVRRSEVRPPRHGVINTRSVDTGQFVKAGAVLATLVDTSRLRLRFKVAGSEAQSVREGGTVQFKVAALPTQDFPAKVYHVGEVADASTRQVEIQAWVQNPGVLRPGSFAEVALATQSRPGALVVPEGAVHASEKGFVAFVSSGGTAHLRPIEIGLRTGTGVVEILSGLKEGEGVIVEGSDRLADGVPVQTPSPSPSRAGGSAE